MEKMNKVKHDFTIEIDPVISEQFKIGSVFTLQIETEYIVSQAKVKIIHRRKKNNIMKLYGITKDITIKSAGNITQDIQQAWDSNERDKSGIQENKE